MHDRFKNIINSDKPVLVDFYADWCAPCKKMPPILKEIKNHFKDNIRIIKVNVDRNTVIASKYRIQSIPTLLLFRNGELKWQSSGVHPSHVLRQNIQAYL